MQNFFKDNESLKFYLKNSDFSEISDLRGNDSQTAVSDYEKHLSLLGRLCAEDFKPLAAAADKDGTLFDGNTVSYSKATQKQLELLAKSRMMGFTLPTKYQGLNCPGTLYCMAIEMVSRADGALMNLFGLQDDIANTVLKYADDEIIQAVLPKLSGGEWTAAMALTEPDCGSDLQSVQMKATQKEDGTWILNGEKKFITNGRAEVMLVLARSEEGTKDARGLSMFLYLKDEHVKIRRIEKKLGINASPTCELEFHDAPAFLIGKRKFGLIKYVMSLMNEARLGISAQAVGIAESSYRAALDFSSKRHQFSQPISELTQVKEMLVNMKTEIEAARSLLYFTGILVDLKEGVEKRSEQDKEYSKENRARLKELGSLAALLTPMSKAFSTEMANRVAYDGIQVHGGVGYMMENDPQRFYRDARITTIYEGTTQMQVVAAVAGILKGSLTSLLKKEMEQLRACKFPERDKIEKMQSAFSDALLFVKEQDDVKYLEYHSPRLVKIGTNVLISILLLKESVLDESRKKFLNHFLEMTYEETLGLCRRVQSKENFLMQF